MSEDNNFKDCDGVNHFTPDSVVISVIDKFTNRAKIGKDKYGKTLDRKDLEFEEWIVHLQEELMDATLYLEKIKQEYELLKSSIPSSNSSTSSSKEKGCILS